MGLMFTLVGLILTVFGSATTGSPIYARSLGYNANLYWGIVLLAFGLTMFLMGRRNQRKLDSEARRIASAPGQPKLVKSEPTPRRGH
jgi:hypothetical protein